MAKYHIKQDKINQHAIELDHKLNGHEFTEDQIVFIESYCTTLDWKRAALDAGYDRNYAHTLSKYPPIQKAIQERLRKQKVNPAEVVNNAGRIMRTDIRDFIKIETETDEEGVEQTTVRFDLEAAIRDDTTYGIKRITFYRDGSVKDVELENRLVAIEMIGRLFALFPEHQREADDRSLLERLAALPFDDGAKAEELGKIMRALRPKQTTIEGDVLADAKVEDAEQSPDTPLG